MSRSSFATVSEGAWSFERDAALRAVVPLLVVNFGLAVGLVPMYVVIVVVSAVIVTLFVDSYAAMAVLAAGCTKLEVVVLFIGGILAPLVDFGALTVIYLPVWNEKRACSALGFYHAFMSCILRENG